MGKNTESLFRIIGATNHTKEGYEREKNDYYATEPIAIDILLNKDEGGFIFPSKKILECCCGEGNLSKKLIEYGYEVESSDLIDRGYGKIKNVFEIDKWDGSICSNPPYDEALEIIKHCLDIIPDGQAVVMFLKLTFLEGKERKKFFLENPPKKLLVSSSRVVCAKNNQFTDEKGKKISSAIAYGWYIWIKGYKGETTIKWVN